MLLLVFIYCVCSLANAHHPSAPVVVQIHQRAGVLHHFFPRVHERLCNFDAIVDVVAAPAPVEAARGVARSAVLLGVAVAALQLPLAAGPGNGIDHSR